MNTTCPQCGLSLAPSALACPGDGAPDALGCCARCARLAAVTFAYGGGYPPGGGGGYGGGAPPQGTPRCQLGHDIAPGASYCPQGHPIAIDSMPFAPSGNPQGGYPGQEAYPQQGGYPQQQGYPPQQGGYPAQGGYAPPPQQGGYPAQGGYPGQEAYPQQGQAPYGGQPAPGGYPAQQGGYADPNAGYGGYAPPGGPQGYAPQGAPPVQSPYGAPPDPNAGAAPGQQPVVYEPSPHPPQLGPTSLRGFLVSYQTNAQGEFWPLFGGRLAVGRANSGEQVDIALNDATISSKHAAVVVDGAIGSVVVEDRGSTNGTYVNEEHIGYSGRRELKDGDKLRFGGYTTYVKIVRF